MNSATYTNGLFFVRTVTSSRPPSVANRRADTKQSYNNVLENVFAENMRDARLKIRCPKFRKS
jgi:hypothetical protein